MSNAHSTATSALIAALTEPFAVLGPVAETLRAHVARAATNPGAELADQLVELAGTDPDRQAMLLDLIALVARRMACGDRSPDGEAESAAWRALLVVADRLHGSGVHPIGRPGFLSDTLFQALLEESRRQWPAGAPAHGRRTALAGDVLSGLAVSRQLVDAVSTALGRRAVPTYDALYEYDGPGGLIAIHLDRRGFDAVFHLLLEHECGGTGGHSVLVVHLPDAHDPRQVILGAGEAVVLRGRGTLHAWRRLGEHERRTLIAVGFTDAG